MRKLTHLGGVIWLLSTLLLVGAILAPAAPTRADAADELHAFDAAILGAIEGRLRGRLPEAIATDLLVSGSDRITAETVAGMTALLDGFVLAAVTPLARGNNQDGDFTIEAALYFADDSGRYFALGVTAAYRPVTTDTASLDPDGADPDSAESGGVDLVAAAWAPFFAADPVTEMFVLPAVALRGADAATLGDYRRFHGFVRDHAIPMHDAAPFLGRDAYAMVTFTKAAMAPDARLSIRVADRPETTSGRPADTRYIVYDDFWRAAITGGRFDLDDIDPFWLKAIFYPGADQKDIAIALVGLYRSHPAR